MTVYVDQFPNSGWGKWNGGGHMLGTDLEELHRFAAQLGLKAGWFQDHTRFAHYDLTRSKRVRAVSLGAVEIEFGELPRDILMRSSDGTYEQRWIMLARRAMAS